MPKIVDYRKQLEAGEEFFIKEERYHKMYKLLNAKDLPGLFIMHANDIMLPGYYVFIEANQLLRVLTASGVALVAPPVPFHDILFVQ